MSAAGVSVAMLASVLTFAPPVLTSGAAAKPSRSAAGRAGLPGQAGWQGAGDGICPPAGAGIGLLLSGRGYPGQRGDGAAHGREAGVRMTAPAASMPVTGGRPAPGW
jgi:hypothetical protein